MGPSFLQQTWIEQVTLDRSSTSFSLQARPGWLFLVPLSPAKLPVIYPFFPILALHRFWPTDFFQTRRRSNLLICLIAIFGLNDLVILFCFNSVTSNFGLWYADCRALCPRPLVKTATCRIFVEMLSDSDLFTSESPLQICATSHSRCFPLYQSPLVLPRRVFLDVWNGFVV